MPKARSQSRHHPDASKLSSTAQCGQAMIDSTLRPRVRPKIAASPHALGATAFAGTSATARLAAIGVTLDHRRGSPKQRTALAPGVEIPVAAEYQRGARRWHVAAM